MIIRAQKMLERWLPAMEKWIAECPGRSDLSVYGSGEDGWGVQTNQKAFAAFAVMAAVTGQPARQQATRVRTALRLLRFSLASHKSGDYQCLDGKQWGHTWISALGIERMMHGVEAIRPWLEPSDLAALKRVLLSESDWLLNHYEVKADLLAATGENRPESNIWNGSLLYRTACMYPDHPQAEAYVEKAQQFLANGLSFPEDARDEQLWDGHSLRDLHVGANFFSSGALNHHGYLNVGYMVICLSNLAMLHFACRQQGWRTPELLDLHTERLWRLVRHCTFEDGRLLRIGGDTRMRYTYCQDYVWPTWLLAGDRYGAEGTLHLTDQWLSQIEREQNYSVDGSFLGHRLADLAQQSPLYYTRLESDRAVSLSMGMAWSHMLATHAEQPAPDMGATALQAATALGETWSDRHHGAYLQRGEQRIASWVWESAEKPQGLIVPADRSDMAEWRHNLAGHLAGLGKISKQRVLRQDGVTFDGGFLTWGETVVYSEGFLEEGVAQKEIAHCQTVCAALPDDRHMIVMQHATAPSHPAYLGQMAGLHLLIPNDVFNGHVRTYRHAHGRHHASGAAGGIRPAEQVETRSDWLVIDERLTVQTAYGCQALSIVKPGRREIGLTPAIRHGDSPGALYADQICGDWRNTPVQLAPHEKIWDAGYVLGVGSELANIGEDNQLAQPEGVRVVQVEGADGHCYLVVANFSKSDQLACLSYAASQLSIVDNGKEVLPDNTNGEASFCNVPAGSGRILYVKNRL